VLGYRGASLLPAIASEDGRSTSAWFWKVAASAIQGDHAIDDVSAMYASQGRDSASPLIDDLGHSQSGTSGASHHRSLWQGCELWRPFRWSSLVGSRIACA